MKSVMSHSFSRVPTADIPRSSFDRSHGYKTTFDAGYLIPFYVDEALPGDTFNLNTTLFGRLATPLKPVMDNMFLETFFFFVPNRLIWDNWERFNGAQDNPSDSTDYLVPQVPAPAGGFPSSCICDYFGLPVGVAGISVNALHSRAYNLIWNEWFRDQNLQNSVVVDTDDGPDTPTDYVLLRRGKRHDYFTSCLPFPQKSEDVLLPLGTDAPVTGLGKWTQNFGGTNVSVYETDGSAATTYSSAQFIDNNASNDELFYVEEDPNNTGYPNVRADLSNATAATINALRLSFQLQKLYERDARGGTRYTEIVRSHFGVMSPDARLQRPEYLGGGSSMMNINPVAQTGESGTTPQGNLSAFGTVSAYNHGFTKSFTEHGVILGIVNVRADITYQQGTPRMFDRRDRFDFYWPALSHIGEQAVLNKEIYTDGTSNDDDVFGYQERYAEYRYFPSKITGLFRSNPSAGSSLDIWHLSEDFSSLPSLNASFIEDNPPVDRIIATPTEPHIILDAYFRIKCARPMPVYAVPGLIDHF
jgi:hypothetical protein